MAGPHYGGLSSEADVGNRIVSSFVRFPRPAVKGGQEAGIADWGCRDLGKAFSWTAEKPAGLRPGRRTAPPHVGHLAARIQTIRRHSQYNARHTTRRITLQPMTLPTTNVAGRLTAMAQTMPDADRRRRAAGLRPPGKAAVPADQLPATRPAERPHRPGTGPARRAAGARLALLVRPGIDFIALTFAIFKAGAVAILIDPGMGRRNLIRCLAEAQPHGFVAIPAVHAVRTLLRRRFPGRGGT